MNDLLEVDFIIIRKIKDEVGRTTRLVGRVVEDGRLRDQTLELTVSQVIQYISRGGTFYTGLEEDGEIDLGGELMFVDEEDRVRLRTVEGTDEKYHLGSLPVAAKNDSE